MNKSNACQVCGKIKTKQELIPAAAVRSDIITILLKTHPNWSNEGYICTDDLNKYRNKYIYSLLESERGELTELEEKVLQSMKDQETLAINVDAEFQTKLSFGEHLSDKIATFGGSWRRPGSPRWRRHRSTPSPAVSVNGWRWPGRWWVAPASCWPTNRRPSRMTTRRPESAIYWPPPPKAVRWW